MIFIVINLILSMIGNIRHGLEVTALCVTFSVTAVKALTTVSIISVHDEILFWWFDYTLQNKLVGTKYVYLLHCVKICPVFHRSRAKIEAKESTLLAPCIHRYQSLFLYKHKSYVYSSQLPLPHSYRYNGLTTPFMKKILNTSFTWTDILISLQTTWHEHISVPLKYGHKSSYLDINRYLDFH